jgi:hypothetical protein
MADDKRPAPTAAQGCSGAFVAVGVWFVWSMLSGKDDHASQPAPRRLYMGDRATVNEATFGCRSQEDLNEFRKIAGSKDEVAARAFMADRIDDGACRLFLHGTRVIAHDWATFSNAFCVRQVGEPTCFWVNAGRVTADEAPKPVPGAAQDRAGEKSP